jgi:ABC-type uncharacterized transport system permease subunit
MLDLSFFIDWFKAGLRLGAPLAITGTGGVYGERSGVFNIGIEGLMLTGAFFAALGCHYTGSLLVGLVSAMAGAVLIGLFFSYFVVTRKADQIVCGIALNLGALGLTNFLYSTTLARVPRVRLPGFPHVKVPFLSDIPILGPLFFDHSLVVYLTVVVVVLGGWVLYNTSWGLLVRAAGEYPQAVQAAGISVHRVQHFAIMFESLMAGLAGATISLGEAHIFSPGMTAGRGFMVLAAHIFGKWDPGRVGLACLFFGLADALQLRAQTYGIGIPPQILLMTPYVLTVFVLVGFVGRSPMPSHLGFPYDPEEEQE